MSAYDMLYYQFHSLTCSFGFSVCVRERVPLPRVRAESIGRVWGATGVAHPRLVAQPPPSTKTARDAGSLCIQVSAVGGLCIQVSGA